ncbi:MAG: hypothetical protein O7F76_07790 [Planctomycetota bacterium]|nr:hypothetical protein [Planctomycetota bacterium]
MTGGSVRIAFTQLVDLDSFDTHFDNAALFTELAASIIGGDIDGDSDSNDLSLFSAVLLGTDTDLTHVCD